MILEAMSVLQVQRVISGHLQVQLVKDSRETVLLEVYLESPQVLCIPLDGLDTLAFRAIMDLETGYEVFQQYITARASVWRFFVGYPPKHLDPASYCKVLSDSDPDRDESGYQCESGYQKRHFSLKSYLKPNTLIKSQVLCQLS